MLSKLVLGSAQMGMNYGVNNYFGKISIDESHKILKKARSAGITVIDTAEAYGDAHKIIGDYNRSNQNSKFEVITKIPSGFNHNFLIDKIDGYLNDLYVDSVDLLMFHSFESYLENPEAIDILRKLKSLGKIKKIGVSVYNNNEIEYLLGDTDISVVQLPFNLFDNINLRGDFIRKLKERGKQIHTRSTFLQGLFFKDLEDKNIIVQALRFQLEQLQEIVSFLGCSMQELALSYCLHQSNIDNVIIGVDSLDHLDRNLQASLYQIEEDTIRKVNNIIIKNIDLLNPSLW